jgi:hypothetical protein
MAAVRCGTSHGWIVASHPHVSKVITGRNARRTSLGLQIPINLHLSLDTTLRSRRADSLALRSGRYESLGHELELLYYSTILCPSSTIRPPFLAPSHMSHIKASKATGMQMASVPACLRPNFSPNAPSEVVNSHVPSHTSLHIPSPRTPHSLTAYPSITGCTPPPNRNPFHLAPTHLIIFLSLHTRCHVSLLDQSPSLTSYPTSFHPWGESYDHQPNVGDQLSNGP